ncbi:hypothetical protein HII36_30975 [Nonomuraea sp. NN258]|uniref:hypothetical protein n=1 Tax=Nonomuraea antri TaxID=2730852 RepID=UPI00156A0471|nr:hypothetical protein [Nonomuraea antri]NRQ36227.1 hypothetical protein [Nonomuraea antri]
MIRRSFMLAACTATALVVPLAPGSIAPVSTAPVSTALVSTATASTASAAHTPAAHVASGSLVVGFGGPTAAQLKKALVTKWNGKKAHLVRSGKGRSVIAGQADWAYSRLPGRCRTATTAGLLFTGHLTGRPAALSMLDTGKSFHGETLISVPPSVRLPARSVPPRCDRVVVRDGGKKITVRIVPVTELPHIPGAEVSAVKMILSPSPWSHLRHPELMLTVVRSGSVVLETYTDSGDGHVEQAANAFTVAAWSRVAKWGRTPSGTLTL